MHIIFVYQGDVSHRQALLNGMTEQSYDVRIDLNDVLIQFCRAHFYEKLQECKDSYKPSFGGTLSDLLIRINNAKRDDILTGNLLLISQGNNSIV